MLEALAGRTHEVVSGLCLRDAGVGGAAHARRRASRSARSTPPTSTRYVAAGEWEGRAGALRDPGPRRERSSSGSTATT